MTTAPETGSTSNNSNTKLQQEPTGKMTKEKFHKIQVKAQFGLKWRKA